MPNRQKALFVFMMAGMIASLSYVASIIGAVMDDERLTNASFVGYGLAAIMILWSIWAVIKNP